MNKKKVIVFGSLNTDLSIACDTIPSKGETIFGNNFILNAGGKGGNQAVALAKSDTETFMIASVGNDYFGDFLINSIKEFGVNTTYVTKSKDKTSGVAVIIRENNDNRIIVDSASNLELTTKQVEEVLTKISNKNDYFLTQFECDYNTTLESLKTAKKLGLTTVFNPAPVKEIPVDYYLFIDLLIVNQSECKSLTGIYPKTKEEAKEGCLIFKEKGVSNIVITMSKEGSFAYYNNDYHYQKAFTVEVVDTTSAGDTYIGTLISKLILEESIENSMNYASKAASLTCKTVGAMKSIPTKVEILI